MSTFNKLFNLGPVSRVRRNHGLEHATLNILARKYPHTPMGGHSDFNGFYIIGNIPTAAVEEAVAQALGRLQGGETNLAIHANCGTNFVAAGTLAGLAAWLGMLGSDQGLRKKLERLPLVILLATVALVFAQPLGLFLQARLTTSSEPQDLQITQISTRRRGALPAHRILTQG
jgi:hypothetical protein